jgi:hypothetical protein
LVDNRGMLRRFNDAFAYVPRWLGCLIAGVVTFIGMTALLAVSGSASPLPGAAICGCAVALITFAAEHFKERRGRDL